MLHQKNSQNARIDACPLLKNVRPPTRNSAWVFQQWNLVRIIAAIKEFFKYEGAGNDFVLLDDRANEFDANDQGLIVRLCDRHFGIGGDGLMLLRKSTAADFEMVYFNADGRTSSMCGNGGRCIARFAADLGIIEREATFLAIDGMHKAEVLESGVRLEMADVSSLEELEDGSLLLDTGSPHLIKRVDSLQLEDFIEQARAIRYSRRFRSAGVNVNFVIETEEGLALRTYERGVENETLACGTGVTAAAIAQNHWDGKTREVKVRAVGGELAVSFDVNRGHYSNIWKTGPATFVFKGAIEL